MLITLRAVKGSTKSTNQPIKQSKSFHLRLHVQAFFSEEEQGRNMIDVEKQNSYEKRQDGSI